MRAALKARFESLEKRAADAETELARRAPAGAVASLKADLANARDKILNLESEVERVRAAAQGAADAAETSALKAVKVVKDRTEEIGVAAASHGSAIADLQAALADVRAKAHDHPEAAPIENPPAPAAEAENVKPISGRTRKAAAE